MKTELRKIKRDLRRKRTRKLIKGTKNKPRLVIFKSLKHIYAQVIDDQQGKTLTQASDKLLKIETKTKAAEKAVAVGAEIAKKTIKLGIKKVVFDKAGYKYHGRVKALADAARKAGLRF